MEPSPKEISAKCLKGNAVVVACFKNSCQSPSLMCSDIACECLKVHMSCQSEAFLNKLILKLKSKGDSPLTLLSEIYSWYENQVKAITVEMEHLKKIIDRHQFRLFGEEEKLYEYLTEGRSDLVIPSLVASVQEALYKTNDVQQKASQTKGLLEKEQREVRKILENVRRLVEDKVEKNAESTVPCNFKFHPQLHHPNFTIVDDQTVRVKNDVGYGAALLEPSLLASNYTSCKVRLRIKRTIVSDFFFGVCQLTPNFRITDSDIYDKIQHGSFTHYGKNNIELGNSQGHRKESSHMTKYQTNDQIEIEYWRETERVEVRNTTKGTKSVSFIKSDKNLSLYFGVLLSEKDDQVKIIGGECK